MLGDRAGSIKIKVCSWLGCTRLIKNTLNNSECVIQTESGSGNDTRKARRITYQLKQEEKVKKRHGSFGANERRVDVFWECACVCGEDEAKRLRNEIKKKRN